MGISGTTAKSRKRKFVPSSHPEPFPVVYGIFEGTRALRYNQRDGEGDTVPENFGIYSFIEHDRFDFLYIRRTNKGCHVHAMCKMLLF